MYDLYKTVYCHTPNLPHLLFYFVHFQTQKLLIFHLWLKQGCTLHFCIYNIRKIIYQILVSLTKTYPLYARKLWLTRYKSFRYCLTIICAYKYVLCLVMPLSFL